MGRCLQLAFSISQPEHVRVWAGIIKQKENQGNPASKMGGPENVEKFCILDYCSLSSCRKFNYSPYKF